MTDLTGQRIHVVTPHYNPRGGVIKIIDYAQHCATAGAEVAVYSTDYADPGLPLFGIERLIGVTEQIRFVDHMNVPIGLDDLVLFTWPRDFIGLAAAAPAGFDQRRFVHMVQNTRHTNVTFNRGYARRLLRQPISRISVSDEVETEIAPLLPVDSPHAMVAEGHDWAYFRPEFRSWPIDRPLRVGFTSWKSVRGHELAARNANDERFTFRSIDGVAGWPELRELYQWADIFLGLPDPQEGFYMVGYEAMAAGALLVIPDVEGNMAYCSFGENCLPARFDDLDSYQAALEQLASTPADDLSAMRTNGYQTVERFDLATERDEVVAFMHTVANLTAGVH